MTARRQMWAALAVAIVGCSRGATGGSSVQREQPGPRPGCDLAPTADCGAGQLPRLADKSWTAEEQQRFFARASEGPVAIERDGDRARLLERCKLPGGYTEVAGDAGSGRFWATNRVLLRADEISAECRSATHVVAAFARTAAAFGAVLVPLPCPPTSEAAPARGCLGQGLTGPERRARALALLAEIPKSDAASPDVGRSLSIYALMPDDHRGISAIARMNGGDCSLSEQGAWLAKQYRLSRDKDHEITVTPKTDSDPDDVPRIDPLASQVSCRARPVFLRCFPGLFNAAPSAVGCWYVPSHHD